MKKWLVVCLTLLSITLTACESRNEAPSNEDTIGDVAIERINSNYVQHLI